MFGCMKTFPLKLVVAFAVIVGTLSSQAHAQTETLSSQLEPTTIISSFSRENLDGSFAGLELLLMLPLLHENTVAAAEAQLQNPNSDIRFAAIYLLMNLTAPEVAPSLNDELFSHRIMAAATLVQLGDPAAIPILIKALSSVKLIPYYDPPLPASNLAQRLLLAYVDAGIRVSPADSDGNVTVRSQHWDDWWKKNAGSIHWNLSQQRFISNR